MCLSIAIEQPDSVLATGEHAGFQWTVTNNGMGYRCGYVRVPQGHPWHGQHYGDIEADVHGGLTFAEPDVPYGKGGDDNAYWVGFDAAHSGDLPDPSLPGATQSKYGVFGPMGFMLDMADDMSGVRTQEYMEVECRSLCDQAAKAMTEVTTA